MAYSSVQELIDAIVGNKKTYESTTDKNVQNKEHNKALEYYNKLIDMGRKDVADTLKTSNAQQAQTYSDTIKKTGKTGARDYLYSLGRGYNLSQKDIDNLIKWDNDTKEISFAGKKIGTPDSIVDGVSYFDDTSVLDNAFKDYITRENVPTSYKTQEGAYGNTIMDTYRKLIDSATLDLDNADKIADTYGTKAKNSSLAKDTSNNGGNIDSYSIANAERQNIYAKNATKNAIFNRLLNIMQQYGVDVSGIQEREETSKNNELNRQILKSEVTGYNPMEWSIEDNPYFDEKGQLIDVGMNYKAEIDKAKQQLAITSDEAERERLQAKINYLNQARNFKTKNYEEFKKFAKDNEPITREKTQSAKEFGKTIELNRNEIDSNERTQKYISDNELKGVDRQAQASENVAKTNATADIYGYDKNYDIATYEAESNDEYKSDKNAIKSVVSAFNDKWKDSKVSKPKGEAVIIVNDDGTYSINKNVTRPESYWSYITQAVLKNKNISNESAYEFLSSLGISDDQILATNEWTRKNNPD